MPLGWDRASSRDWGDSKGVSFAHSELVQSSFFFCSREAGSAGGCSSSMRDSGGYKWSSALIFRINVLARGGYRQLLAPAETGPIVPLCRDASALPPAPFRSVAIAWQQPVGLIEQPGA